MDEIREKFEIFESFNDLIVSMQLRSKSQMTGNSLPLPLIKSGDIGNINPKGAHCSQMHAKILF